MRRPPLSLPRRALRVPVRACCWRSCCRCTRCASSPSEPSRVAAPHGANHRRLRWQPLLRVEQGGSGGQAARARGACRGGRQRRGSPVRAGSRVGAAAAGLAARRVAAQALAWRAPPPESVNYGAVDAAAFAPAISMHHCVMHCSKHPRQGRTKGRAGKWSSRVAGGERRRAARAAAAALRRQPFWACGTPHSSLVAPSSMPKEPETRVRRGLTGRRAGLACRRAGPAVELMIAARCVLVFLQERRRQQRI